MPGRYDLDTIAADNAVRRNTGNVTTDSLWGAVSAPGGFRLDNSRSDRDYMYATSDGEAKRNTGSTDGSAVWVFERK
ncbi:hypothetical protein C8D88_1242 [Lentzea atacamensis]|uniref:Uncharacterized protein n=1 Tax=Lentzea atacamensis TaxID=531938 RepID=A0A316HG69_9PSEU|nr:hypothetical protein [Lentzea atacamensis]PWK79476.1 hypothetical protein C8D88_1242 [Lentzea atacamensis]